MSAWTRRMLSGQSTNQTTWAELSRVWCDRCDWHGTEARVSMLFAFSGPHGGLLSPTRCLFRDFQAASEDRFWDNYRRFALFRMEGMLAYVRSWLRASMPVSKANLRHAFVHHTVWPHVIAWPRNVTSVDVPSLLLGLLSYLFPFRNTRLSIYWLGQQTWTALVDGLTSRQNRCSEVANDAGIARKRQATALTNHGRRSRGGQGGQVLASPPEFGAGGR